MRYFTLVRRPVDQALSQVRYRYETMPDVQLAESGTPSLRDIVAWGLDGPEQALTENMQTDWLALYPWRDSEAPACDPAAISTWPGDVRAAYRRERLGVAKDLLRGFFAVGTVDRVIPTLEVIAKRAAPLGLALLPAQEITLENVSKTRIDDTSWIDENDEVGRRLLGAFEEDRALYEYANELLDEALAVTR